MADGYVATGIVVTLTGVGDSLNADLQDISIGGDTADQIDMTHQGSSDNAREFLSGLVDGGEVTLTLLFDSDKTIPAAGTNATTLTVTFPNSDANKYSATVNVQHVGSVTGTLGDKMVQDVTVKVTGLANWSAS